jgi:hypothetical protein
MCIVHQDRSIQSKKKCVVAVSEKRTDQKGDKTAVK